MMNRRDILKLGAGSVALSALNMFSVESQAAVKKLPLCIQLYSIGGVQDPTKQFPELVKYGYKGIEYAGVGAGSLDKHHGFTVQELRKFQDDFGLFCNGSHAGRDLIEKPELLKRAIEWHKALGAKFIICPGMGNKGIDGWKKAGENFAKAAEIAKKAGIYVGYHAHQHDFEIIDKENNLSSWEVFADASSDDVVLQIDLGHCINKGADMFKLIKKYPGRSKSVHVKESDNKVVGEGRVDWKRSFALLESVGGVETYTIEFEGNMRGKMEYAKRSADGFFKVYV